MSVNKALAAGTAAILGLASLAAAGFDSSSTGNLAIYWGQNSINLATGTPGAQQRLSYYCDNSAIDIIPVSFLVGMSTPSVNFANAGDNCTAFAGSTLLECPQIAEDIKACQAAGKTILLSIGGATYTEGGFSSSDAAVAAAENVWAMFGPTSSSSSVNRPFDDAVVDGFDFDFESATSNMAPFASKLRSLADAATAAGDKTYYLSAAPQCPYPDAADNDMLNGAVAFDFIMIQFYNNYCGVQSYVAGATEQNNFNFATWDTWAKDTSKNKNVKILVGIPGSSSAGAGYSSGTQLSGALTYAKTYSSFGGVMVWDASQIYANSGFLDEVVSDIGASSASSASTALAASSDSSSSSSSSSSSASSSPASPSPASSSSSSSPSPSSSSSSSPSPSPSSSSSPSSVVFSTSFTSYTTKPTYAANAQAPPSIPGRKGACSFVKRVTKREPAPTKHA